MRINKPPAYALLAGVFLLVLLALWLVRHGKQDDQLQAPPGSASPGGDTLHPGGKQSASPVSALASGGQINNRLANQPAAPLTSVSALRELIEKTAKQLAGKSLSGEEARALLEALRDAIFSSDPQLAVQAILEFLDSGTDEATMLAFEVGPGGTLAGAPTMRVALLDWLGQLDISAAEGYSSKWLDRPGNSGEWAMHMRNLAWADPEQTRVGRLVNSLAWTLDNTDWPEAAPPGYLETFDLLPYTADPSLFARLSDLAGDPNEGALPWAVFLAIDRTVLKNPDQVLNVLAEDPRLLGATPEVRASLMARADIRSGSQREALQTYLRRKDLTAAEAETFASLYPNYNLLVGYRLFTSADSDGSSMTEYAARDRAAFELLATWEQDPSIAPAFRSTLPRLRTRLAEHLASARRAQDSGEFADEP